MDKNVYIGGRILDRMVKKEILVFLVLGIFVISFVGADEPAPFDVQGFVYDAVTGDVRNDPVVDVWIKGYPYHGSTKVTEDNAGKPNNHAYGHYSALPFGINGEEFTVVVHDRANPSCKGEAKGNVDFFGLNYVDVYLCCYPTVASNLQPSSVVIGAASVDLTWSKGHKTGYSVPLEAYEFWQMFSGLGISLPVDIGISETKHVDLVGAFSGSWNIETCAGVKGDDDKKMCCVPASSSGSSKNDPCPAPKNLVGKYDNGDALITMFWDSGGSDPNGHPTHFEWRAVSLEDGENLQGDLWDDFDYVDAISGEEVVGAELATYWQVRCCDIYPDMGGCSGWVTAVTPSCNEISSSCPNLYDVGTGGMMGRLGSLLDRPRPFSTLWGWMWLILRILVVAYIIFYENDKRAKARKKGREGEFKIKKIKVERYGSGR